MDILVAVLGVVAALAVVIWFAVGRSAERAASHLPEEPPRNARFDRYNERPGSPGAEGQQVVDPGSITAGPGEGPSTGEGPRTPLLP